MSDLTPAPAPAPSPAPPAASPAPSPAPAPAAPSPAPAPNTLFSPAPPAPSPSPAPSGDAPAWLPEKYRVTGADGKLDLTASNQKLGEGYAAAVKRLGTGDLPPETPDGYKFTPPEELKDAAPTDEMTKGFRERAHKAGLTPAQYEFFMGEYFALVPSLLDAKASHTAETARAELQKVWPAPADLSANMSNAERAVSLAPPGLQEKLREQYATDPLFWQFAAHYGKQLREDSPPSGAAPASAPSDVEALMKHAAYRDPKHPEHAAISARVVAIQKQRFGEAMVVG